MRSRLRHAMPSDLVKWANEWRRGCGEDEGERACSRGAHTCGTSARVVTAHPGELCVSTAYAGNNREDSVMADPVQLAEAGWDDLSVQTVLPLLVAAHTSRASRTS